MLRDCVKTSNYPNRPLDNIIIYDSIEVGIKHKDKLMKNTDTANTLEALASVIKLLDDKGNEIRILGNCGFEDDCMIVTFGIKPKVIESNQPHQKAHFFYTRHVDTVKKYINDEITVKMGVPILECQNIQTTIEKKIN